MTRDEMVEVVSAREIARKLDYDDDDLTVRDAARAALAALEDAGIGFYDTRTHWAAPLEAQGGRKDLYFHEVRDAHLAEQRETKP